MKKICLVLSLLCACNLSCKKKHKRTIKKTRSVKKGKASPRQQAYANEPPELRKWLIQLRYDGYWKKKLQALKKLDKQKTVTPATIALFIKTLEHPNLALQFGALHALEKHGHQAFSLLAKAIKHPSFNVRYLMLDIIRQSGKKRPKEVLDILKKALASKDIKIQNRALYVLGKMRAGALPALPLMLRFLQYQMPHSLRATAIQAIGKTGVQALPYLQKSLQYDPHKQVRFLAAFGLYDLKGKAAPATSTLLGALKDKDKHVRSWSLRALENIAKASPKHRQDILYAFLSKDNALRLKLAWTYINLPRDVDPLLWKQLQAPEWQIRRAVIWILMKRGGSKACRKELIPLFTDPAHTVRTNVIAAYWKLCKRDKEAMKKLGPLLLQSVKDNQGQVQKNALITFRNLGPSVSHLLPELMNSKKSILPRNTTRFGKAIQALQGKLKR